MTPMRHRAVLTRAESLRLAGSVPFGRAALHPWLDEEADELIAISADLVTGYRMTAGPARLPAAT